MHFRAVRPHSAPEMLVKQILAGIQRGELQPGERLPGQRNLAVTFGVSLSSVREAVKTLHTMGCLRVVHGKGTFIAGDAACRERSHHHLDIALEVVSLFDLMQAREIMECRAVEIAAAVANDGDRERIRHALARIEASTCDPAEFYRADLAFHIVLAEATANMAICEIVKRLVKQVHRHHTVAMTQGVQNPTLPDLHEKSLSTARRLCYHVQAGDGGNAALWMQRHLDVVMDALRCNFPHNSSMEAELPAPQPTTDGCRRKDECA